MKKKYALLSSLAFLFVFFACACTVQNDKIYTVTFVQYAVDDVVLQVKSGDAVSERDMPVPKNRTGYFSEWNKKEISKVTEDVTIACIYTPKTYTVMFNTLNGTLKDEEGNTLDKDTVTDCVYDAPYSFPSAERDGYRFAGWYLWRMTYPDQEISLSYGKIAENGIWKVCNETKGVRKVTVYATWEYDIVFRQDGYEDVVLTCSISANGNTLIKEEDIPEPKQEDGFLSEWELTKDEILKLNKNTVVKAVRS